MSTKIKRVLVTGARAPVTLHLCRMLKNGGVEVFAADSVSYAVTKASNSIHHFFCLPSARNHPTEYISSLLNIIQKYNIDLLIPTCEESFYISMNKEKLSFYCDVLVGDFDSMKLLHDKYTFIKYVDNLGFQTPKTLKLTADMDRSKIVDKFQDNVVVKRIFSRFSDKVLFFHKSETENFSSCFDFNWIIQERLEGKQFCSYGIAKNGKLLAHSVYKTEFSAGVGATISFSYTERKDVERFVKALVQDLNFTGQLSFDFIVTKDDIAVPIECNPRATSGLHLFEKELVSRIMEDCDFNTLYPKPTTKEAIFLALIVYSLDNLKRNKHIGDWLNIWKTHRDIVFRINDVRPFFYQFASLFFVWRESRKNKLTMTEQTTFDIAWNGEEL